MQKAKKWTEEEDEILLSMYKDNERQEIAKILNRTIGSIRKRCSTLKLNSKNLLWTDGDTRIMVAWYKRDGADVDLDLETLSKHMGRTKPFIARKAREMGLTVRNRPLTENAKNIIGEKMKSYISENGHPRGATGLRHTDETKARFSEIHKGWSDRSTDEEIKARSSKMLATRIERYGTAAPHAMLGEKMYTRAKGGKRADLGDMYFRSRWEANYARYLNFLVASGSILAWEFEPKTFLFEGVTRGPFSYKPDFLITENDGRKVWHEVKGWMDSKSKGKLNRMATMFPEETIIVIAPPEYRAIAKKMAGVIKEWEVG